VVSLFARTALCSFLIFAIYGIAAGQAPGAEEESTTSAASAPDGHRPEIERRSWKLKRGAKDISVEFAYAPMQPTFFSGRKEYDTDGRKFTMTSIRFGRVVGTAKRVTYQYLFEVIPVSFAVKNEVKARIPEGRDPERFTKTVRENTYGIGFEPAAFRFLFTPSRRLKPYAQAGAGFIFTSKPIPVPESPRYNFIGDFGGGLMYSLSERRTVNFGYRYFHISNMNIGEINPGYNANVFYVGYSLFSK
jgi:opacity protein-like surface antigen